MTCRVLHRVEPGRRVVWEIQRARHAAFNDRQTHAKTRFTRTGGSGGDDTPQTFGHHVAQGPTFACGEVRRVGEQIIGNFQRRLQARSIPERNGVVKSRLPVRGIGKISDIFAASGLTERVRFSI